MVKGDVSKNLSLIANSSLIVLIGIILSKILSYVYRIVIARAYGPEPYGLFNLAMTVIGIATALALLGTSDTTMRFISFYIGRKDIQKARFAYRYIRNLTAMLSVAMTVILFFGADTLSILLLKNYSFAPYLRIFSFSILFVVLARPYLNILRAYEKIGWYSFIYNILQNVVKVGLILIMIWIGYSSESISISYVASTLALFLAAFFVVHYKIKNMLGPVEMNEKKYDCIKKEIFSYSWPLLFYGVAQLALYWIDSISLAYFKDAIIVGYYNAAAPLAIMITAIPELFTQLFAPLLTKHYARKRYSLMIELSKQINKWILAIALPVTLILIVMPQFPLRVLFGQEYLIASVPLSILAIGYLFFTSSYISQNILSIYGKTKILLFGIVIASVSNLILNFIFIPLPKILWMNNENGMVGAALATMISYGLLSLIYLVSAYNNLKALPLRRKAIKLLIAIIISTMIYLLISKYNLFEGIMNFNLTLYHIVLISILALTYLISAILLKTFDKYDIEIIKNYLIKFNLLNKRLKK